MIFFKVFSECFSAPHQLGTLMQQIPKFHSPALSQTLDTRNSSKLIPEVRKERFCSKFSRFHVNNVTESLLSTAPTKSFVRDYFWAQHKCLAQQKLSQHRLPRTRFHTQPELSRATSQLLAPPQQIVQHPPEAQLSLGSKKVKLNTKEDEF